ncbi:Vacuolar protein sorting-associated protein 41 [Dermatophagoides pteronyssinus]|uniref:Vacuolar protein sorting-associated protein 41 n=1 Tax=Dermatophagoides pteronyssinus TaxID=6956 RepID=A0ABQ8JF03_DERPT|nr:Vacuolar protein sorting-associated protein 41 [Dermatophagoides pteronyssinus]
MDTDSCVESESTIYLNDETNPSIILPNQTTSTMTIDDNRHDGTNDHHNGIQNDDNEDDDDDDDDEPKFTYSRIRGDVSNILKTESITSIATHEKFFVIGTQSGKMFVLNIDGFNCSNTLNNLHQSPINQISIDERADFLASCSDYRVCIQELYTIGEPHYSTTFERPVKALAIDPQYGTLNSRRFVVGEADRLLFFEKNLLGRYRATCLQQARGVVRLANWNGNFIVWASDLCLKIYDSQTKTIITHLDRDKENDYRIKLDLYQCSFQWRNNRTLLISWGNSIKICNIRQRNYDSELSLTQAVISQERIRKYYVELVNSFNIDSHLIACGVAPFEQDRLLILCTQKSFLYPSVDDSIPNDSTTLNENQKLVRIKMVEPKNADIFTDISDDILTPNEFLKTVQKTRDIQMIYYREENAYLIICPRDLIIARPREEDDSIDWLLSRKKFRHAFQRMKINQHKCLRHTYESVGQLFIKHLLIESTIDSCEEAGKLCHELCLENWNLWEIQLNLFRQYNCLRVLAKYLPIGLDNQRLLAPHLYEMVLVEFLDQDDSQGFLRTIKSLPPHLYSTNSMINHLTTKLSSQIQQDHNLLESLAEMYTYECHYQKAFFIFLQTGNAKRVFDLIWKHRLLHLLEDRFVELLELDAEETSRLLIENQDSIPCDKVIKRLRKHPRLLCAYLDRLIQRDPTACTLYHDLLFDLYAKHVPDRIVPFLRQSNYIQLEKALEVCKKQQLTKAVVFILGRMGNTHEALRIIIDKTDDINAAIDFCKEHGDADLWAELMDISVSKPNLLSKLLREVGTNATDPISLISRIPEGETIPDLVPSLVQILQDYRLMVTLEDGCRRVLNSDCYQQFSKMYRMRSKAVVVRDTERYCYSCQIPGVSTHHQTTITTYGEYILFQCAHLFHTSCLDFFDNNDDNIKMEKHLFQQQKLCPICKTKKNGKNQNTPVIPSYSSSSLTNTMANNNNNKISSLISLFFF